MARRAEASRGFRKGKGHYVSLLALSRHLAWAGPKQIAGERQTCDPTNERIILFTTLGVCFSTQPPDCMHCAWGSRIRCICCIRCIMLRLDSFATSQWRTRY